jgi:DNA-binding transcriptional ArsR family regulator
LSRRVQVLAPLFQVRENVVLGVRAEPACLFEPWYCRLDLPPHRECNQSELTEQADVSRRSVSRHLDLLLDSDVRERGENTRPQRYRFGPESDVSQAVVRFDAAMNAAGPNA